MPGERDIGPFAYLQQICAEIHDARAAGIVSDLPQDNPRPAASSITDDNQLQDMLHCADWQIRSRGIKELFRAGHSALEERCLQHIYQIAFDDTDARVRGTAWIALASAVRDGRCLEPLTKLTVRAFIDRFKAHAEFHDKLEAGARHWLWTLARQLNRPEEERLAIQARKAHLEALAGPDGPIIDRLRPDEAAAFLDHPEASHRLAALAALSRTIRTPAVRSALVDRAAELVGIDKAVSVLTESAVLHSEPSGDVQGSGLYAARIRQMATCDPDLRVRSAAVYALGFLHWRTHDLGVERDLARFALDRQRPDHMRYIACHALAMVRGLPLSEWPIERARRRSNEAFLHLEPFFRYESVQDVEWEHDVDWDFVTNCALASS